MSPGQDPMNILPFAPVYYDKRDHVMKSKDMTRPDDFIEISGSKVCPSPTTAPQLSPTFLSLTTVLYAYTPSPI